MMDRAYEAVASEPALTRVRERRLLDMHTAPAAKRTHELDDVVGEAAARRREPDRAEALDPAVGVEQTAQQIETVVPRRIEIRARNEFLVTLQAPQAELPMVLDNGFAAMPDTPRTWPRWRCTMRQSTRPA